MLQAKICTPDTKVALTLENQSEDCCKEVSLHQANSNTEEKGTNGQRDTCTY